MLLFLPSCGALLSIDSNSDHQCIYLIVLALALVIVVLYLLYRSQLDTRISRKKQKTIDTDLYGSSLFKNNLGISDTIETNDNHTDESCSTQMEVIEMDTRKYKMKVLIDTDSGSTVGANPISKSQMRELGSSGLLVENNSKKVSVSYNINEDKFVLDINEFLDQRSSVLNDFLKNKESLNLVVKLFVSTYSETNKRLYEEGKYRIKSIFGFSELLVKSVYACRKDSQVFHDEIGFMFYHVCDYFFMLTENKVRLDTNYSMLSLEKLPTSSPKTRESFEMVTSFWEESMDNISPKVLK